MPQRGTGLKTKVAPSSNGASAQSPGLHAQRATLGTRNSAISTPSGLRQITRRSSIIESFNLASVDEAKAHIPLPEPGSNKISRRDYQLATQVDAADSLDAYIQRSWLTIQG